MQTGSSERKLNLSWVSQKKGIANYHFLNAAFNHNLPKHTPMVGDKIRGPSGQNNYCH